MGVELHLIVIEFPSITADVICGKMAPSVGVMTKPCPFLHPCGTDNKHSCWAVNNITSRNLSRPVATSPLRLLYEIELFTPRTAHRS